MRRQAWPSSRRGYSYSLGARPGINPLPPILGLNRALISSTAILVLERAGNDITPRVAGREVEVPLQEVRKPGEVEAPFQVLRPLAVFGAYWGGLVCWFVFKFVVWSDEIYLKFSSYDLKK